MNSRPTIVLFLLLSLCGWSIAQVRPSAVVGEGAASHFWLAQTFIDANGAALTSIRQRTDPTSGKWEEIARLQDHVTALAGTGDRLAVATPTDWRLVWQGGGTLGPPLPGERSISRLAGDGDAIWATGGPALFRWDAEHGWVERATLPAEAGGGVGSLAVRDGVPWVAYLSGKTVCVDRAEAAGWVRVASLPMTPIFKLLTAGPSPLLAWRDVAGLWTIYDLTAAPPKALRSVPTTGPSDVALAGTSLRVLSFDKNNVSQQGFDDFGRGAAFGPDVIAQVVPLVTQNTEWPNFFMMGLVTAALVVGMRSRTLPTVEDLSAAHVRIAPLGRRLAAGVIDAVPYLLGLIYVSRRFDGTPMSVEDAPQELFLPIFVGLTVYVLHVAISELLFGRSLGKFIFRLRVVAIDGTRAAPGRIVLRNLMRVLDVALGLPFLFVILSPTGQRFGDMAARTLVVADAVDEKAV